MANNSGISPTGRRVLVRLDPVPTSYGTIEYTQARIDADQQAQVRATLIEAGPEAWAGKSGLEAGSRVTFRRYSGERLIGVDNVWYSVMNDEDIYATFTDPNPREDSHE